ncbi:MAG TPA: hypothetical protein VFX59_10805 [Polyangiales bacterium]|nr:hypothetical protein [Polyangiales bacterium]
MRTHARVFGGLALCLSSLAGCSTDGDYQVAVSWIINGTTPSAEMCQEHGIARARFEVRSQGGSRMKTVEGDCAELITLSTDVDVAGFYTSDAFEWDTRYNYTLTLVDAAGTPVSLPASASFQVGYGQADVFELNYLDYVAPVGRSASLTGEWQFANGSQASVATDCAAAGISRVRILATSALDYETLADSVTVAEADCSAGRFVSNGPVLATGDYLFFYQALRADGTVATTSDTQAQFADFNSSIVLMRSSFFGK